MTVDGTCKGCGNVMRGLTPNNIAYCMDCGTDNPNPLNLEQPVYAQVMGRGALSQPKQPAGVVVTREWLEETIAALKHASHCFHETMLDGKEVENARNNRDNCARLAAESRRKAGG